jgi:hypothetical protein
MEPIKNSLHLVVSGREESAKVLEVGEVIQVAAERHELGERLRKAITQVPLHRGCGN